MWYSVISDIPFVLGQLDYVLLSEVICRVSSVCLLYLFPFCGHFVLVVLWLGCMWVVGVGFCRVAHGYTAGRVFPHRTRTRVHRNPWRVRPIPYRNSHGVKRNPQYLWYPQFLFIKIL